MLKRLTSIAFLLLLTLNLMACFSSARKDGPPPRRYTRINFNKIPNAVPKKLPRSHYGNPKTYSALGKRYHVLKTARGYDERGIASWYGTKFHGQLTASREPYNMFAMTAASPVLPIPSFVRVTNLANGRSIVVKINDRGPFAPNRIIDLSYAAAKKLGYAHKGTALVEVKDVDLFDAPIYHNDHTADRAPKLFLQVAAFRLRSHAERLKHRIQSVVHRPVTITRSRYKLLPIYRVRIGPLLGVSESDHLQSELKNLGLGEAITQID